MHKQMIIWREVGEGRGCGVLNDVLGVMMNCVM